MVHFSCLALLFTLAPSPETKTFVLSESDRVEDVALRDRAYADWNFGASPFLEAGFMPGVRESQYRKSRVMGAYRKAREFSWEPSGR